MEDESEDWVVLFLFGGFILDKYIRGLIIRWVNVFRWIFMLVLERLIYYFLWVSLGKGLIDVLLVNFYVCFVRGIKFFVCDFLGNILNSL